MATVDVKMPSMGESITEGTVITWYKEVGDSVELDEMLLEISTDKVDTDVPSPASGILKEILVADGEVVNVGEPIALVETVGASDGMASGEDEKQKKAEEAVSVETPSPPHVRDVSVIMPKMGESITEGTVIAWHKKPGDAVDLDETLLEIGTDKVDTDLPSPSAGILKEILVEAGDTVDVGSVLAIVGTEEDVKVLPEPAENVAHVVTEKVEEEPSPAHAHEEELASSSRHLSDGRFLSPLVRSIAHAEGLSMGELGKLEGSGRDGRLTKKDILQYINTRSTRVSSTQTVVVPEEVSPVSSDSSRVEIIEMDRMRQLIAQHMINSKRTSAHVTSFAEVDVTNLVRLRERQKASFEQRNGVKLTYTPFFVYAAVEALRGHSILNASVDGNRILINKEYHVGIAVALGTRGLVVPVIRHAGRKSIAGLAHHAYDLAQRARTSQLQPDDLQGGTFTVTNVGSLGSVMGTPIILQPQVAILAVGSIKKKPVVIEDPILGDMIGIRHMMYISLSYDHRIIDGAMGISYLRRFVEVIEGIDPSTDV